MDFRWLKPMAPTPINPIRNFMSLRALRTDLLRLSWFLRLGPIFQKNFHAQIGQRMIIELFQHIVTHRAYIGADQSGFEDMQRMAHGGGQDLGLISVVGINGFNLAHHIHADMSDGVESADEWTDISCSA